VPSSPRWCFREVVTDRRLTHQASSDVAIATDDDRQLLAHGSMGPSSSDVNRKLRASTTALVSVRIVIKRS
jgi:hypothetical protein